MKTLLLLLSCLLPTVLQAAAPQAMLDNGTIRFFLNNKGSFAYNEELALYGGPGLFYPPEYPVDLMGGAGIWVAGKVGGEWRVSIAGGASEFVPGPAHTYDTLETEFPVFALQRSANPDLSDDYQHWPVSLGAPTDLFGRPLIQGSQTCFTVFADTDSLAHRFSISGSSPLGIEGRLTTYIFDNIYQTFDTMLAQVVILEYSITNISDETIDSCILSLYADPDIGYSRNDLIASDSAGRGMYAYQPDNYDTYFGPNPPVAGLTILSGELGSANYYHLFSEYDSLSQTVNLMRGYDLQGTPYLDPTSAATTHYPFGGDPATGSGWLAEESADYRLMLNLQPAALAPGATQRLKAAVVVARGGTDVMAGTRRWRETVQMLQALEHDPPVPELAISPPVVNAPSGNQFRGENWGGRFLDGGLDLAARYFNRQTATTELPLFQLEFEDVASQDAYRYRRIGSEWLFAGMSRLPLTLTGSDGTEYEVGWLDYNDDGTWIDDFAAVEPLLLFALERESEVRPELSGNGWVDTALGTAIVLDLANVPSELVGSVLNIDAGAMERSFSEFPGEFDLGTVALGGVAERSLEIRNETGFVQQVMLALRGAAEVSLHPASLELGSGETARVFLRYHPQRETELNASLIVNSYGYDLVSDTIALHGSAGAPLNAGDLNASGELDLGDLVLLTRALFEADLELPYTDRCDSDCDADFDLVDLVSFINRFFYGAELTCR